MNKYQARFMILIWGAMTLSIILGRIDPDNMWSYTAGQVGFDVGCVLGWFLSPRESR